MVCLGNLCRSPLAEGILKDKIKKAGLDWEIDSAGTNHYQTGKEPHNLSQKVAHSHGVDISNQACRQFTALDMIYFDKIYVMDEDNYADVKKLSKDLWDESKVDLLLNEIYPSENKSIPDPWFGQEEDYHKVYELISQACDKVIEKYRDTKHYQDLR